MVPGVNGRKFQIICKYKKKRKEKSDEFLKPYGYQLTTIIPFKQNCTCLRSGDSILYL